ncbi:speriolin-like protein [Anomaloglossus baeobatrachus]|uniref:speriolin-like protein n=1 Tax=Anomaloglossus baeobatrachus TaxID=238106 RepID=UPI003F4FA21E
MFSGTSTNYNMDNPGLYSGDEEAFNTESLRLLKEKAKLRKLMGLMQENMELRCTLKEHERKAQIITPPGQHKKDHNGMKEKKNTEISQHHYLREEAQMVNTGLDLDLENIKKCQRIVGELAFQLDRRILSAIFLEQQRMYGYRVPNIKEKIIQVTTIPATGKVNQKLRYELNQRYNHTMDELRKFGYNPTVHPHFTEYIVNTYGITKDRHAKTEDLSSYNDPQYLNKMINECMPRDIVEDIIIILNCLVYFAREDGKSLLI